MSDKTSEKPPLLYWTCIFKSTVEPNKSPSSVIFCSWGKVIVTFAASTFVLVIWRVTAFDSPEATVPNGLVGDVPTVEVAWLLSLPTTWNWVAVPKRGVNSTLWKLKSDAWGFVLLAVDFKSGVSSKKTSFCAALL